MEDMEIDQIVEVPDTPDRLTARHVVGQKYAGNPDVLDERFVNERRERGCHVAENGNNRRPSICPVKNFHSNEINSLRNVIEVSPSRKPYAPRNGPIFRRISTDTIFGDETTHANRAEKIEKEKAIRTKLPSKSSCYGDLAAFDLTDDGGQPQQLKSAFSHRGLKDNATVDKKEQNTGVGSSYVPFIPDSSNTSSHGFTGKCKSDNNTVSSANLNEIRGKGIDLSSDFDQKTEKQISLPPCGFTAPRVSGQKRLVRNGCISPHNIATMAKQSAEQNGRGNHNVEQSNAGHAVSSDAMTVINVDDIVAEERGSSRVKGKEVLVHPSSSNAHDSGTMNTTISHVINDKEASGTSHAIRNSVSCIGPPGGWRSTRNHRNYDRPIYDVTRHHSRRNIDAGNYISARCRNRLNLRDTRGGQSSRDLPSSPEDCAAQETSVSMAEVDQYAGPRLTVSTLPKRQRKHELTSRDPNGYSPEVMFLGSSGESSSNSSSYRTLVLPEVVELSPETRFRNRAPQDLDEMNNEDSDARARQVEADEILARELQEQLYHEDPFEGRAIDEHLAWELQHEDEILHMSIESDQILQPRRISRAPSNRQPPSRSHRNSTNMRRSVAPVPLPNRMSQLRSHLQSRSPARAASSRGRRLRFPLDMDLDMRLDILEALEDAVGDLSDMGIAGDFFQTQRDFNENDYEMLLALDENNHQHGGASANQINSLPQSTVQTDNFEEACAICLESPAKGETIRHLPCLHKFHKDCIDPWLQRKTSCPVCKSAVT